MAIVNINGLPGELAATGSSSTAIGSKHIVKKYPWIPNAGIDIGRLEKEIETDIQQIAELLFDIEEGKFSTGFEGNLVDLQRKLMDTEKYGMGFSDPRVLYTVLKYKHTLKPKPKH